MQAQVQGTPQEHVSIPDKMFFRIGDVSEIVGVKPYVLRYWESEFPALSPNKSNSGQRVYKRTDVETLLLIKHLLYNERYSIEGARRRIRELRRDKELTSYKKEIVFGGEDVFKQKEQLEDIKKVASELKSIVRKPIREIFRA